MSKRKGIMVSEQHQNLDLFFTSSFEIASGKLSLDYLEHPLFSLQSRGKDMSAYQYTSNDGQVKFSVKPSTKGRMTIRDADFVVFIQAKLVQMKKEGILISETPELVVEVAEFLEFSNRGKGGNSYANVEDMLDRLSGTTIEAEYDISNTKRKLDKTSIIDPEWSMISQKNSSELISFKVKLRSWFVKPILETNHYLTISREFFKIGSDIHRRFWQIARMHCNKSEFKIGWVKFHNKLGSKQSLSVARSRIRKEMKENGGFIRILDFILTESIDRKQVIIREIPEEKEIKLLSKDN